MQNYKILLTKEQIQNRVKELGKEISKDYANKTPVVICMLKGAVVFFSDLVRNLNIPLSMEFVRLSSYRNGTKSGKIEVVNDLNVDIKGKDVLIIEDVVDSGKTLCFFIDLLKKKNPSSIKICTFLDKPDKRESKIKVDYVGFSLNCGFVIGYGLDYAERYRELSFLAEINFPTDLND